MEASMSAERFSPEEREALRARRAARSLRGDTPESPAKEAIWVERWRGGDKTGHRKAASCAKVGYAADHVCGLPLDGVAAVGGHRALHPLPHRTSSCYGRIRRPGASPGLRSDRERI